MPRACLFFKEWRDRPVHEDDIASWFAPGARRRTRNTDPSHERSGRVVYLEQLVARQFTVQRFFDLPFELVLMCVRDETLALFHVDMLRRVDETFSCVAILYSDWAEQLTPAFCETVGLTMQRLLDGGLAKHHVRELRWRLGAWRSLFGMDASHVRKLGIRDMHAHFDDVADPGCARLISITL